MNIVDKINNQGIELYFKYEYLDIETVLKLFRYLNQMHETVLKTTSPVYFNERTQERFRNILDITELSTGQSIRTKFSEKWKVELPFGLGNVEGPFPKKLGIPMIVTFFILIAAAKGYDIYNSHLDSTLKEIEIELKRNELYKQMEERQRIDPTFRTTIRQATQMVNYIHENPDITYFEINQIPIKDRR